MSSASVLDQQTAPIPSCLSPPHAVAEGNGPFTYALFTASDLQFRAPDFQPSTCVRNLPAVFVFSPVYAQSMVIRYSYSIFASCLNVASLRSGLLKFLAPHPRYFKFCGDFQPSMISEMLRVCHQCSSNLRIPVE